jgi:hypothetical protein
MSVAIVFIYVMVIIDKIFIAGVVGRVDVDNINFVSVGFFKKF